MQEIWKPVVGYEGLYEVSNLGDIKGLKHNKILNPSKNYGGYKFVRLSKNNKIKNFLVHRIVAINFMENKNNLPEVNHKDGNKLNNSVNNLEWVTKSDNHKHAHKFGLKVSPFKIGYNKFHKGKFGINHHSSVTVSQYSLDGIFIKDICGMHEAQRITGIFYNNISACCRGKTKSAGGFIWKFKPLPLPPHH